MEKPPPHVLELMRRLLAIPGEVVDAAVVTARMETRYRELWALLSGIIGTGGMLAITQRALFLATREHPWMASVQATREGALPGMVDAVTGEGSTVGGEGCAGLLANIVFLLVTFTGGGLTSRLIQRAWPELGPVDLSAKTGDP